MACGMGHFVQDQSDGVRLSRGLFFFWQFFSAYR